MDVALHWPSATTSIPPGLPLPWLDVEAALACVSASAASLPFAKLAGDTLTWKLAGCIQAAAAGLPPRVDHAFAAADLTAVFEQLVVQLHDFPAPPPLYRPQADEPALPSSERIRTIVGFSGAGKTSWVSQAALHTVGDVFYFNVGDTPSRALVGTVSRELATHLYGGDGSKLGEVLLPGSTGVEILLAINRQLASQHATATLVIDNAHRVSADDIRALPTGSEQLSFVLLCQPSATVQEIAARLAVRAEELRGWTTDTIAAEGQSCGCQGDFAAYERLRGLTAGLPLYVQNALRIAANEYGGSVARFCADIDAQTHLVETVQELILRRAFAEFAAPERAGLGALALSETPLDRSDMIALLKAAANLGDPQIAALLRRARSTGLIHVYGRDRIKLHDAVRTIARAGLTDAGEETVRRSQIALRDVLISSMQKSWSLKKVSQLMRIFVALGEIKPMVELASDELFHEMGIFEQVLLPYTTQVKLAARVIPIRSQYAVALAYCGDFAAAEAEMERLAPYEAGLSPEGQTELQTQRCLIARLRVIPPPPQWRPGALPPRAPTRSMQGPRRKIGRNDPCFCGSGICASTTARRRVSSGARRSRSPMIERSRARISRSFASCSALGVSSA